MLFTLSTRKGSDLCPLSLLKKENIFTCMSLDLFWECETLRGENDKKKPLKYLKYLIH